MSLLHGLSCARNFTSLEQHFRLKLRCRQTIILCEGHEWSLKLLQRFPEVKTLLKLRPTLWKRHEGNLMNAGLKAEEPSWQCSADPLKVRSEDFWLIPALTPSGWNNICCHVLFWTLSLYLIHCVTSCRVCWWKVKSSHSVHEVRCVWEVAELTAPKCCLR